MTDTKRPEIQRYDPDLKYIGAGRYVAVLSKSEYGDCVMHEDHLRAVTLAKIEVLEEMPMRVLDDGKRVYLDTQSEMWARKKIAVLRKEISDGK